MSDDTITFTQRQLSSLLHFQSTYWLNEVRSFDDFIEAEVGKRDAVLHPKEGWVYLNDAGNMVASVEIYEQGRPGHKPGEWLPTYTARIFKGQQIHNDLIDAKEFEFAIYITGDINDPLGARGWVRQQLKVVEGEPRPAWVRLSREHDARVKAAGGNITPWTAHS